MSKDKAKIEKIVLKLGGVEAGMSLEQAKELYDVLHGLFGGRTVYIPSQPIYVDRYPWWKPYYWGSYSNSTGQNQQKMQEYFNSNTLTLCATTPASREEE